MTARDLARDIMACCKPGQSYHVDRSTLYRLDKPYGWAVADWILESITGSAYEYSYTTDIMDGSVTFHRRTTPLADGSYTYLSPDRREGFQQGADGLWRRHAF